MPFTEPKDLPAPPADVADEQRTSLTEKVLRETSRFAALQVLSASLGGLAQVALARLLDRRDFGVFGICQFYLGLGQLLGDGGLGATLLQRKGAATREEYRSTLTALLALAAVLAGALFSLAPWIAQYNQLSAQEVSVLRVMAPLYFIDALRVVPYVKLERELLFSAIARVELASNLTRHGSSLVLAAAGCGVWALVWAYLASCLVQLTLAYCAAPGWAGIGFEWSVFRPLITYGSKVQALNLFGYFKDNIARAGLGRFIGPSGVGVYDFGLQFIQFPVNAVNGLARVQLPVYSRLEAPDPALHAALRGAMRTALLAGMPLLGALALASSWAVPFMYGDKWAGAVPVIWGLLLNMVCGLVISPVITLLQGQGRAGFALYVFGAWTSLIWIAALAALVILPENLGAAAAAQSVATLAITSYLLLSASRHLGRSALAGLGAPLIAGTLALVAAGISIGFAVHPIHAALAFLTLYTLVLYALEGRQLLAEAKTLLAAARGR